MLTLSSSNSIFQLAVGVNAVLPVLISDYEGIRDKAADSTLRKIQELNPTFELKERDRQEFISFTLRSTTGLRYAQRLTFWMAVISITLSAASLTALCWAAIEPERTISVKELLVFVGVTLIASPLFYVATNRHLKWIYSILERKSSTEESDVALFSEIVTSYLAFQKSWEQHEQKMDDLLATIPFIIWRARFSLLAMRFKRVYFDTLYKIRFWFNRL